MFLVKSILSVKNDVTLAQTLHGKDRAHHAELSDALAGKFLCK